MPAALREMTAREAAGVPVNQAAQAEIAALRKEVAALSARLAGMERSAPWRLATGLHRVARRFRKG